MVYNVVDIIVKVVITIFNLIKHCKYYVVMLDYLRKELYFMKIYKMDNKNYYFSKQVFKELFLYRKGDEFVKEYESYFRKGLKKIWC